MSPILYRLKSALGRQLGATVALTLTVVAMLGLVVTLVAGSVRTLSTSDRFAAAVQGDFDIAIDQSAAMPTTAEIGALDAVEQVVSATFVFGFLTEPGQDQPVDAIVFTGAVDAIAGTRMTAGRQPDPERPDEIVVSSAFTAQTGAQLGDSFELWTLTQEQADASAFDNPNPDGPTVTAVIVGEFGGASDLQDGYAAALFSKALLDLGDVGLGGGANAVQLAAGTTIDDLRTQLDTLPNGSDLTIGQAESVPEAVRRAVETQGRGLSVLAAFGAAAAVAVLGQLLGRQYRMTDVERLALQTIGMTRRQLVADPLARAAVPIVGGSIAATGLAVALSGWFPTGFVEQIEPDPGLRFDPLVHLVGTLALCLLLLGWVSIGLAMSNRPVTVRAGTPAIERLATRLRPAQVATGARFAFSGAGNKRWSIGSFVGLLTMMGVAIGALTFGANLARLVDEPVRWGSANLSVGSGGDAIPERVRTVLANDPDVAAVTYYANTTVSVGTDGLNIVGIQPARGEFLPATLSGRLPQSDDEIVLGEVSARALDVGVGDAFDVSSEAGLTRLRVTGLAVIPGVERGNGIGEGGVVTAGGLQRIAPSPVFNNAGLELRPGAPDGTAERLATDIGLSIHDAQAPPEIVNLDRVRTIPLLVAGVLAAFAVLSLTHQLVVSARNRRRDVGILKALGADRGFVSEVVHVQATVFTAVVTLFAVPIGVIAGRSVYRLIADGIGAGDGVMLPIAALVAVVAAPLVFANFVAALPAHRARRLRPALYLNQE